MFLRMRAPLLTVAAALAACGLAVAQNGDGSVTDGNDSKSRVDIATARAAFDRSNDRLAHIVRFHAAISPRNFRNAVRARPARNGLREHLDERARRGRHRRTTTSV